MKPTSLSPEFYENLYNKINSFNYEPESSDDSLRHMDFEDFEGFYVSLDAIFDLIYVDDSFDHAFGMEYAYHYEVGDLLEVGDVELTNEDCEDMSHLFDVQAFMDVINRKRA